MAKKKIEKQLQSSSNLTAPQKIKLLFTIVDRVKVDFYLDVLEGYEVNFQTVVYGKGTAPNELLGMLGITSDDKALILSVIKEEKEKDILYSYKEKYFKTRHGKGIAFTVPISSMIGVMAYQFLSNNHTGGNK